MVLRHCRRGSPPGPWFRRSFIYLDVELQVGRSVRAGTRGLSCARSGDQVVRIHEKPCGIELLVQELERHIEPLQGSGESSTTTKGNVGARWTSGPATISGVAHVCGATSSCHAVEHAHSSV